MLTFYPELDVSGDDEALVVIVMLDCSNSMRGQAFTNALKVKSSMYKCSQGQVEHLQALSR